VQGYHKRSTTVAAETVVAVERLGRDVVVTHEGFEYRDDKYLVVPAKSLPPNALVGGGNRATLNATGSPPSRGGRDFGVKRTRESFFGRPFPIRRYYLVVNQPWYVMRAPNMALWPKSRVFVKRCGSQNDVTRSITGRDDVTSTDRTEKPSLSG